MEVSASSSRRVDELLEALTNPNRRAIVEILSAGEETVQVLADQLPISRPAVSRHLKVLKNAGVVTDQEDGAKRVYRLEEGGVDELRSYLDAVWTNAIDRFRIVAENTAPTAGRDPE